MNLPTAMQLHNALSQWQAPELPATGPTPATDVYGYGLLLSAMLTILLSKHSREPFDGEALLRKLIDGCLKPMPNDRSTASELLQIISASNPEVREGDMFTAQPSLVVDPLPEGVAEHWRLVPIMRHAYGVVVQDMDIVYLSTAPINGADEHPLRRLSFEIRCHDQGKEGTSTSFSTLICCFN